MPVNRAQLAFAALVAEANDPITPTQILPDGSVKLGTFTVKIAAPPPEIPFVNDEPPAP